MATKKKVAATTPRLATALQKAVVGNRLDEVRDLLDQGVDPNQLVKEQSALAWAVYKGFDAVATLLLERKADPNIGTSYPCAGGAMHAAATKGRIEMLRVLLEHGGDPNAVGQFKSRPLVSAIENDDMRMVRALLDAGARPELEDARGKTAWHTALKSNDPAMFERIVATDPSRVSKPFADGSTLLHHAAQTGADKLIDVLIERGVSVDARDGADRVTALHYAAWRDAPKVIERLLAHGADPSATTSRGLTALDTATTSGSKKAVTALKRTSPRRG